MFFTPHILTGLLFGGLANNPFVAFFLGMLSYFFIEMIPHWDLRGSKKSYVMVIRYLDFVVAIFSFLIVVALKQMSIDFVAGGLGSALVYLSFLIMHELRIENSLTDFTKKIKYTDRTVWGVLIQFSLCIICVAVMFNLVDFPTWERMKENILINFLRLSS